jgi:hypothetical protein
MLGLLYGYWSGISTWIFQLPPLKGAVSGQFACSWYSAVLSQHTFFGALEPYIELLPVDHELWGEIAGLGKTDTGRVSNKIRKG